MRLPRLSIPVPGFAVRRALALVIVVGAIVASGMWLYQSPAFSIRNVEVTGNVGLSAVLVRDVSALEGESIIRADFESARERLMALPLVKDARVSRDWPSGARITIVERTAWGVWLAGGERFVIDEEGVVIDLVAPEGVPMIVQTDALPARLVAGDRVDVGAIEVARRLVSTAEQALGLPVTALEFTQAGGLTAALGRDLRVNFGDAEDYDFKIAALFAVLEGAAEDGRTLHTVDLRFGDRVAVQ